MKRINFLLAIMAAILTGCIEEPTNPQNPGGTTTPTETVTAEFSYKLTPPLKITLFDHSEGSSIVYDLGDGTTVYAQAKQAITHKYAKPGKYKIVGRAYNMEETVSDSYAENVTIPEPDMYIYLLTWKQIPVDGANYWIYGLTWGDDFAQYYTGKTQLTKSMLPYDVRFNATIVPINAGEGTDVQLCWDGGTETATIPKEAIYNAGCPDVLTIGQKAKVDIHLTYINPE